VMSQQGGGVNYDTLSSSSGTLYLQNNTVTVSGSGANTTLAAPIVTATTVNATTGNITTVNATTVNAGTVNAGSVVTPSLTLSGRTVTGIATGPVGYDNNILATKGYVDGLGNTVKRGIAMTAALQTPTIEPGDNNAVKFSAAGYNDKAGFSFGYARRLWKHVSADIEAAADDSFEDGVVRGGVNYSW